MPRVRISDNLKQILRDPDARKQFSEAMAKRSGTTTEIKVGNVVYAVTMGPPRPERNSESNSSAK